MKKHKHSHVKADIIVEEMDEDKRLITGEVLSDDDEFKKGTSIIFGKYALFPLTLQGIDFYFLDKEDVIGTCLYRE